MASIPSCFHLANLGRCGPYKLAYLLNHCLDRYESPTENTPSGSGPLVAPLSVGMQKITPYSHEMEDSSIPSSPTNTKPALIKWNYSSAESNTESQQDPPRVLIADDNAINRRVRVCLLEMCHVVLVGIKIMYCIMQEYSLLLYKDCMGFSQPSSSTSLDIFSNEIGRAHV